MEDDENSYEESKVDEAIDLTNAEFSEDQLGNEFLNKKKNEGKGAKLG